MCHTAGDAFKNRLVHGVALVIMAYKSFVTLLKSFIANVLKCNAHLKSNFKCTYITVLLSDVVSCSLVHAVSLLNTKALSSIYSTSSHWTIQGNNNSSNTGALTLGDLIHPIYSMVDSSLYSMVDSSLYSKLLVSSSLLMSLLCILYYSHL